MPVSHPFDGFAAPHAVTIVMGTVTRRPIRARKAGRRAGFILLAAALSLSALLAMIGLGVDVGRIYIVRNELQVFADEAAVAAAFELDGTSVGLTRARNAALAGPGSGTTPNRWNFGTQTVTGVTAQFATDPAGPFDANPASATGLRYVRVQANATLSLYFLAVVPGIAGAQSIHAAAVAGQTSRDALGDGLAPFSPTAHNPADPEFRFVQGQLYTLRWAPPGQRDKPGGSCPGDVGFDPGDSSMRGYVDVGQGGGSAALRNAVVNNNFYLPSPLSVGSTVTMLTGEESVPDAVEERFNQDSDVTAQNFAQYSGNGRRVLVTAVTGGGSPATVLGFAAFFLQPTPCGVKSTTPCCAEYIGAAVVSGRRKGAGSPGLYTVQLTQ
jgi:hypothetical protein